MLSQSIINPIQSPICGFDKNDTILLPTDSGLTIDGEVLTVDGEILTVDGE